MLQDYTYHQPTHYHSSVPDDDVLMFDASQSVVADIQLSRATWTNATLTNGSSSEWDMMAVDIDYQRTPGETVFLVIDTNVLISFLRLIQGLLHLLVTINVPIVLLVPGIVIQELDFLKTQRDTRPGQQIDVSSRARQSTSWLLSAVREGGRHGKLRGQKDHETSSGESWKARRKGDLNDDLILECCTFFSRNSGGRAALFSGDVNLSLKCEFNGIPSIRPELGITPERIISTLVPSYDQDRSLTSSRWKSSRQYPYYRPSQNHEAMELDADTSMSTSSSMAHPSQHQLPPPQQQQLPTHPLDILHANLLTHLSQVLPELVYKTAADEKKKEEAVSIHAQTLSFASVDLPSDDSWRRWSALQCVRAASKIPVPHPIASPTSKSTTTKRQQPQPIACPKLQQFLIPSGERGARKGQQWTRGDWQMAMDELEALAKAFEWNDVLVTVTECRNFVDVAFG